jgi:hypothetical protein
VRKKFSTASFGEVAKLFPPEEEFTAARRKAFSSSFLEG